MEGLGLAHTRALGISVDVEEEKGKKKGGRVVYKMLIKRRKRNVGKKTKESGKRSRNTFTTELSLKKGVSQPAKIISSMQFFRKDLHHDALRRLSALNSLATRRKAIRKIAKKDK
eukprot:TRINITY_DN1463_c0_g2_i5.p2 TRINITY_DN1463_c0_g2~~TRINITY_DN1463_c0_g2_i5.p2  ORF type:complete len:115 (-),score=45.50 TRINITY_DN1463_c0_g2_i5:228-572(-)